MLACNSACLTVGEIFSAVWILLDDPTMQHLHWRLLLTLGSIPAVIFCILCAMYLNESPVYLAHAGRVADAQTVLEVMKRENDADEVPIKLSPSERAATQEDRSCRSIVMEQTSLVFGKELRLTTAIAILSCFVLNIGLSSMAYALPQLLSDIFKGSAGAELLIGSIWEFPGILFGLIMGLTIPRKRAMKVYLGLLAMALVAFPFGAQVVEHQWWSDILLYFGYYGIKCFIFTGCVTVYMYVVEVYPTEIRATGAAFTLGTGRIGAICGPLVYESINTHMGFQSFFWGLALLAVVNALMVDLLRIETFGMLLKDTVQTCDEETTFDSEAQTKSYGSFAGGRAKH